MAGYQKNTWVLYDRNIPPQDQPDAYITKKKLDNIEKGIGNAVTDFVMGKVNSGEDASCEIIADELDPSIKKMNLTVPKSSEWIFSDYELTDGSAAPAGTEVNDFILDYKGNVFTVKKSVSGTNIVRKRINIKGIQGDIGTPGKDGLPGQDGLPGADGKDGCKIAYFDISLQDNSNAPDGANAGDFVLDNKSDLFEVDDKLILHKIFNLKGKDGKEYYLEVGNVTVGEKALADIFDHKLNLTLPKAKDGKSAYQIWLDEGYTGTVQDFLTQLKGEQGEPAPWIDFGL